MVKKNSVKIVKEVEESGMLNVEITTALRNSHAEGICLKVNGIKILIQTGFETIRNSVTIYTPDVEICDFSSSECKTLN